MSGSNLGRMGISLLPIAKQTLAYLREIGMG
jgi:hypothetical protein